MCAYYETPHVLIIDNGILIINMIENCRIIVVIINTSKFHLFFAWYDRKFYKHEDCDVYVHISVMLMIRDDQVKMDLPMVIELKDLGNGSKNIAYLVV